MTEQYIRIHPAAPPKPAVGDTCNGCGVCCLAEPCPLGVVVSGRRQGACRALRWDEAARRYRCGMVTDARRVLPGPLKALSGVAQRLALRLIASGAGCDSDARVEGDATGGCD